MIAMLPLLTALAAAEGRPPPGSWLEGDFRSAEAQITARQRWVRVPALGELLFVEWLDAEGRPLRRRMLRLRQGASGSGAGAAALPRRRRLRRARPAAAGARRARAR
ncbi:MAG: hypothetical protein RML12_10040 [Xanthomonadales bacterium]|nr:hypothetical protein [Xanthomonadales bacterium]